MDGQIFGRVRAEDFLKFKRRIFLEYYFNYGFYDVNILFTKTWWYNGPFDDMTGAFDDVTATFDIITVTFDDISISLTKIDQRSLSIQKSSIKMNGSFKCAGLKSKCGPFSFKII